MMYGSRLTLYPLQFEFLINQQLLFVCLFLCVCKLNELFHYFQIIEETNNPAIDSEGLPEGWTMQVAPNGRLFFIDHNAKSTSWVIQYFSPHNNKNLLQIS